MTTETELKANHIAEWGVIVKGWDLDIPAAARAACDEYSSMYGESCINDHEDEPCVWPTYGIAEIWGRKRPVLPGEEYSWYFEKAEPGSRGAGRFTAFYYDYNGYEVHKQIQWSRSEHQ